MSIKIERAVNYTNAKLVDWYVNVKRDYGVIGSGSCQYNKETNKIEIKAIEDGEEMNFSMFFYDNEGIDFYFNVWMTDPNDN